MRLLARILFAALGALLFSQLAEWTQQYLQRLGGTADALRAVVRRFDDGAGAEHLSRAEAIARLKAMPDRLAARQGSDAETTITRYEIVEERYRDLLASPPLLRPFTAASDPDMAIAERVLADFRPALPVTLDGIALTFLGFVGGWGVGTGTAGAVRIVRRRRGRIAT